MRSINKPYYFHCQRCRQDRDGPAIQWPVHPTYPFMSGFVFTVRDVIAKLLPDEPPSRPNYHPVCIDCANALQAALAAKIRLAKDRHRRDLKSQSPPWTERVRRRFGID